MPLPLINKKVDSFIVKEREILIGSNSSIDAKSDDDLDSNDSESESGSENEGKSLRVQSNPPSDKNSDNKKEYNAYLEEELKVDDLHN